ncbi:MAG: hypothetical protein HY747_10475 [Elusimicrobia bacterium]|nr:hypothetical protein [Elusimicrobiota bacterium]
MSYPNPQPSQIPTKEYDWAFAHYPALTKKFPNEWIAFLAGRVLAHGKDPVRVLERAKKVTKVDREIPTLFIEKGIHIYAF